MALVSTLPTCIIHEIFKGCVHQRSDVVTQFQEEWDGIMSFMEGHKFILVSKHGEELNLEREKKSLFWVSYIFQIYHTQ